jgi:hypothetical protein
MDMKDWEKIRIYIKSDEGQKAFQKQLDEIALKEQDTKAYVKPWYECTYHGGADKWNIGFCDSDCRSCSSSDGFVLVNKKKYQFKKHLTEEQCENKEFKSYKESRIFTKLNEEEIDK